ncbi:MAG: hypothetical protein HN348_34420 [Proteobacteria bacterium]|nr:hypothetical protein [Pseudomonadota bacterium]
MTRAEIAVIFLLAGCGAKPQPDTTVENVAFEYIGHDAHVELSTLVFENEAEGVRFKKVRECFADSTAAEGWSHYPLRKIGNFIQEDWCSGPGAERGCSSGTFRDSRRGVSWYGVHTLHYSQHFPLVFGLGVYAGHRPAVGELGLDFSFSQNGKSIVGDGLHLSFVELDSDTTVHLGSQYSYELEQITATFAAPDGPTAELSLFIASAESFRDTATARYNKLLRKVEAKFAAGKVEKCVYGEYEGDGVPPPCIRTPLDKAEAKVLFDRSKADLERQKALITNEYQQMHELLLERLDFTSCW